MRGKGPVVRSVHTGRECGVSPVYTFDLSGLFAGIEPEKAEC